MNTARLEVVIINDCLLMIIRLMFRCNYVSLSLDGFFSRTVTE